MSLLPQNLAHFQDDLKELLALLAPLTKRIYVVGGAVRDVILGKKPKEIDIEVYDISPSQLQELAKILNAKGVGKSFFVYKWRNFDISLPRLESKIANTHQGFEVTLCNDEKKASFRRDFTMNALMLDVLSGKILDFWGGREDIEKKSICYIDKEKFSEDSLRVLRGIQFASRLGFMIEKNTLHVMKNLSLKNLSQTRIFWELEKFFNAPFVELGVLLGYKINLWNRLFSVQVSFDDIFSIATEIKTMNQCAPNHLKKYTFLYVFVSRLNLDMKKTLQKLNAPKNYHKILLNSPYIKAPISDKMLLKLAIDMPLKNWVGICQQKLVKRAKSLNIYEEKFNANITSKEVIKDGFTGKDIGKEIRRRKLEKIYSLTCKKR